MPSRSGWKGGRKPDVAKLVRMQIDERARAKQRALEAYRCPEHGKPLTDVKVTVEGAQLVSAYDACCDVALRGASKVFLSAR